MAEQGDDSVQRDIQKLTLLSFKMVNYERFQKKCCLIPPHLIVHFKLIHILITCRMKFRMRDSSARLKSIDNPIQPVECDADEWECPFIR